MISQNSNERAEKSSCDDIGCVMAVIHCARGEIESVSFEFADE